MSGFLMRSKSGRTWRLGEADSAGRPSTREDAERVARDLGFELVEQCSRPGCGHVAAGATSEWTVHTDAGEPVSVPPHVCRQCSASHCEMGAYLARGHMPA